MKLSLTAIAAAILAACTATMSSVSLAQPVVKIVVPFSEGDASDALARVVARPLSEKLGMAVEIHNKAGAGGIVGFQDVARARTDGRTLVLGSISNMSANTACRGERLGYSPASSFRPVAMLARAPLVVAVKSDSPIQTYEDLLALFSEHPGIQMYASSGLCSYSDLVARYLMKTSSAEVVASPFTGGKQGAQALLNDEVSVLFSELPSLAGLINEGRVRLLANSSEAAGGTSVSFKDIGADHFQTAVGYGFFVPAETPSREARILTNAIRETLADPEIGRQIEAIGAQPQTLTGAEIFREITTLARQMEELVVAETLALE